MEKVMNLKSFFTLINSPSALTEGRSYFVIDSSKKNKQKAKPIDESKETKERINIKESA